jgi:VIT1/CCC1 family predicted Fe2+/Mn2+ transporter
VVGAIAAFAIGAALAGFTGRSVVRSGVRQLLIAVAAAGVTYALGSLVGVTSAV